MSNFKKSWIVFCDSQDIKNRFMKPNFRHVFLLTKDEFNWYMIDPDYRFLNIKILPYRADYNLPGKFLINNNKVICILHKKYTNKHLLNPIRLFTCVEIIKYVLGIQLFCFTPYGLYRKLMKLNVNSSKTIKHVNELKLGVK